MPDAQLKQASDPETEYVPAPHVKQLDDAAEPVISEYVPAAQPMHAVEPATSAYAPAAQLTQVSESFALVDAELVPGGHPMHVLEANAPNVDEYVPAAQLTQTEDPVRRYVPNGHEVTQLDEPKADAEPAEHDEQTAAPGTAEYVPAGQLTHSEAPNVALY